MYFESHDGTRIAYEDYGRGGEGAPIVLVAGAMLPAEMWEYQIPYLVERGHRCVAVDRRGHGRSDRPSTGYDIDTTADDLAALLDHLDLTGVVLVGHSTGGAEVARYLARHGEGRVARVAFVSSTLPFMKQTDDNPGGVPEAVLDGLLAAVRADRPKWLARQTQLYFTTHLGSDVSPEQMDVTYRQCLSTSPWATLRMQEACFHADSREDLRGIGVPTLTVHGDADFSAPAELTGRRTAELLPGGTYVEYEGAGHGLYVSHADRLNADLLKFAAG
ncbi:alpha/beta fold hydrolase [Streptomyces beihaiensis]|uniref:Alpha/beta hydrolase n=1 Tax=Streptomyces beihaiensis TaxID=2984495 RepID=A0ABT3TVU1_9ACTN|nr:alpha/beta hydrolase [Streptomyces beihaiensis]MCX3061146.1 alpha/beta hydrolase [Streptomyces beihaiensis]